MSLKPWDLAGWDAVETAERIARKDVTALEVVEAALGRVETLQKLNAVVTPTAERARAAAATATGPLAGVPTFIKDLAQVAGVRTAWGTAASGTFISKKTDYAVKLIERTGLVSLGKSATPEHGLICATEPMAFGPCLNPWGLEYSTGGSSGGAAALVASGAVPIAHGSDGGGSIRIPASSCGLVGLKPTRKRLDMDGSNLLPVNIAVHGVLSRTVRDTVAFWKAIDAQRPVKKRMLTAEVALRPKRLKVAAFFEPPTKSPIDPQMRSALEKTAAKLVELGHQVELVPFPLSTSVVQDFISLWAWVAYAQPRTGLMVRGKGFVVEQHEPWTHGFAKLFTNAKLRAFRNMFRLRQFTAEHAQLMTKYDVLLCPTTAHPSPRLGHFASDQPFEQGLERVFAYTPFAAASNASGAPAISLPLARSDKGMPMGMHFAAAHNQEQTLLELAFELEAAAPWEKLAPRL